ncbi:fibronectin type III domain-containing protein [Leucobacter sp. HY1910]
MALTQTFWGPRSGNYQLAMTITAVRDTANNRSTIACDIGLQSFNSSSFQMSSYRGQSIGGVVMLDGNYQTEIDPNGYVLIASNSRVINHDSNGDLSVYCAGSLSNSLTAVNVSGTLHVDRIAQAPGTPGAAPGWSRDGSKMRVRGTVSARATSHQLQYRVNSGSGYGGWTTVNANSERLYILSSPVAGATYQWQSRGVNSSGAGPWSATATINWPDTPNTVSSVSLTGSGTSLAASWSAPGNGGAALTGYDIQLYDGSAWGSVIAVSGTNRSFTGLASGGPYKVRVRAKNDIGAGSWRESNTVTLATAPSPPTVTLSRALVASWPAPADGGSTITSYDYEWWDGFAWQGEAATTARTITLRDHYPGVGYRARVRARNAVGVSAWTTTPAVTHDTCTCT